MNSLLIEIDKGLCAFWWWVIQTFYKNHTLILIIYFIDALIAKLNFYKRWVYYFPAYEGE